MYLHDYGDEAASFSKEEIQQGFVYISDCLFRQIQFLANVLVTVLFAAVVIHKVSPFCLCMAHPENYPTVIIFCEFVSICKASW